MKSNISLRILTAWWGYVEELKRPWSDCTDDLFEALSYVFLQVVDNHVPTETYWAALFAVHIWQNDPLSVK